MPDKNEQPEIVPVYKPTENLTVTVRKPREVEVPGRPWVKSRARIKVARGLPGGHLVEVVFQGSDSTDLIPVDDWDLVKRKVREYEL